MTDRIEPPTGEPSDETLELASRYLDGDLTADERAAAQVDPEVMAWVERFGPVRAALQQPMTVDATARDGALAAALAEFDGLAATDATRAVAVTTAAGTVTTSGVSDLAAARSRRNGRLTAWLGAAAAAVAVGVAGITIVGNRDTADRNDFSAATTAPSATVLASEKTAADATRSDAAAADEAPAAAAAVPADTTAAATDTTAAGTLAAGSEEATTAAADTTASPAATTVAPATTAAETTEAPVPTTAPPAFETPDDLRVFAATTPTPAEPITTSPCDATGVVLTVDATYQGVPAVVYLDEGNNTIAAYDATTCDLLISTRRYEP